MRKCRWSSTRHDAVVLTGEFWGFVSVLTATSNVGLCVCLPAPVQFLQSFFPKCQAFHVIVFALLSFSYDSSSSSQYFLHAGSFNPRWCFKAGEGDEQRSPPIRRESRVEEAGTYVTDDESIGQSVCQSVCFTPTRETSSYCKRTSSLSLRPLTPVHPLWREKTVKVTMKVYMSSVDSHLKFT